jgi:hypothetical protein
MISFFVSLQDLFKAAQHPLETLSVDRGYSASVYSLDAGLPANVVQQSQFSKVVTLFVLVNHSWELIMRLLFFSNQIALQNDIKLVSALALLDNVLAILKLFFFQNVIKLLPEIKLKITFPVN